MEQGAFACADSWDEELLLSTAKALSLWKARGLQGFQGSGLELLQRSSALEAEFWAERQGIPRHFETALAARIAEPLFRERYLQAMAQVDQDLDA